MKFKIEEPAPINFKVGVSNQGSSDYKDLTNKPKINDVVLIGNKTLDDLGIQPKGNYADKINIVNETNTTLEIEPNKFYKFGEVSELSITLATPTDVDIYNEYMFEFVSGYIATTLTLPSNIKWLEEPTIESNKTYQCSIVDNIGVLLGVSNE